MSVSASAVGGSVLGYGKRTTVVYTVDDIADEIPDLQRVCITDHARGAGTPRVQCIEGSPSKIVSSLLRATDDVRRRTHFASAVRAQKGKAAAAVAAAGAQVAIKDCGDAAAAESEVLLNARVFSWFTRAKALHLTTLHPRISYLEAFADGDKRHVLPVYAALDGNLNDLALVSDIHEDELLQMAERVLEFLAVLHAHGHIHMDIKPDNILFAYLESDDALASDELDFRLSDYETIEDASYVASRVTSSTPRKFSQGTDGFMSPLLTADGDDSANRVYPRFQAVANACRCAGVFAYGAKSVLRSGRHRQKNDKQEHGLWAALFSAAKDDVANCIWKVDLHSLGLTLLDLMVPPDNDDSQSNQSTVDRRRYPRLAKLLPRLMFFRTRDLWTAQAALLAFRKARAQKPKRKN